jgi:hypothetical protein
VGLLYIVLGGTQVAVVDVLVPSQQLSHRAGEGLCEDRARFNLHLFP